MSMLGDIREAIRVNLVRGIGEKEQTISAYMIKGFQPPTIWVRPASSAPITYHQAMGNGLSFLTLSVDAYCGVQTDITAQQNLDDYLDMTGSRSVFAALESDPTLGGLVDNLVVESCSGYNEFMRADGTSLIGASWIVLVYLT